ncbi:MAG: helix-turn-helix domain-containing protein [Dehalococcoidia bacterium]|nr:helix-turn-helix domain-containing protein [Dehalococcoidia bacterium]
MARTWDAEAVRRLREQLGVTQAELADRIGTRQQTVSEWETGASTPRRMSQRLLRLVAEEAGVYDAGDADERETTAEGGASGGGRAEDAR